MAQQERTRLAQVSDGELSHAQLRCFAMQEVIRKEPIPRLMRLPFTDSREICGRLLRTLGVQKKKGIEQRFFVLFKDVFQQDARLAFSCADATSAK